MAPRLRIADGQGRRTIAVDKAIVSIGRRSESDVCVAEAGVSRLHAEIVSVDGGWLLRDCASKFGTFVNGERADERRLAHGDRIRLGQAEASDITFLLDAEDEPSAGERTAMYAAGELRQIGALLESLRALGSGRVLEDVLKLVLDTAIEVTGAERGFIMLATPQGDLEYKLGRGRDQTTLAGRTFATSRKIPDGVFATGCETILEDLLDEDVAALHSGTVALGIRHVLCTPLRLVRVVERREDRTEDKPIGVLYLDSRERGALRDASVRSALATLGTEAAIAIENARLYREAVERAKMEQELKVAASIQQSLLPPGDRIGAFFRTAAASVPCRAVGGDFFDYLDLPNGRFGFVLGDVAGKGSPAALLAAAALGMFSVEATYQTCAATLVSRLNRGLFRRRIEARFLTAFYGILAPDGSLTYSNAGHNAPLLVTADGVRRLETGGLVLGLFENVSFEEETVSLRAGDVVIAFSDGVTEALNAENEEFTDARLLASVAAHRDDPPQAMLEALLADVRAFCGGATQSDDVTMVVVRYEG